MDTPIDEMELFGLVQTLDLSRVIFRLIINTYIYEHLHSKLQFGLNHFKSLLAKHADYDQINNLECDHTRVFNPFALILNFSENFRTFQYLYMRWYSCLGTNVFNTDQ